MNTWKEIPISELGEVYTGRTPPSKNPEFFGDEYPFITPSDMDGRKFISTTERYLSKAGAELLNRIVVPANSVCVSCIGWQMGKAAMTTRPSITNQQINTIVPNDKITPNFLYYSLLPRKEELLSLGAATGVRTPILNKSAFSSLTVKVPSKTIQHEIASILSAYDDLIENNTRRIAILEEMAQALYREWFVHFRFPGHEEVDGGNGRVPEGWEVKSLGDVVELSYGKGLRKKDRVAGPFPVYGSSGVVDFHDSFFVKGPGIIVGRKGNVGSVFWSNEDFYPIDTTYYVQTELPLHYVYFNLQHQNFFNTHAAVPGLSRQNAYRNDFVIPPVNLMKQFQNFIEPIFAQLRTLRLKNANLRQTRDLLLPRLISGELDVSALPTNAPRRGYETAATGSEHVS